MFFFSSKKLVQPNGSGIMEPVRKIGRSRPLTWFYKYSHLGAFISCSPGDAEYPLENRGLAPIQNCRRTINSRVVSSAVPQTIQSPSPDSLPLL